MAALATTLLFGVAQNHPFVQGNKRTGFEAAVVFLKINGWALDIVSDDRLGDRIVEALADDERRSGFTAFLNGFLKPIEEQT